MQSCNCLGKLLNVSRCLWLLCDLLECVLLLCVRLFRASFSRDGGCHGLLALHLRAVLSRRSLRRLLRSPHSQGRFGSSSIALIPPQAWAC